MRFPTLAFSERYDADGRRLGFQIRPSANQVMREALKRDTAQRRAAIARARLVEKAEASGYSSASGVNPLERAALVNRLRNPGMTDDEVDEIVRIVDAYLSRRLCAADWRSWLRRREQAERVESPSFPRRFNRPAQAGQTFRDGEAWFGAIG
jgi:hypothetical protein